MPWLWRRSAGWAAALAVVGCTQLGSPSVAGVDAAPPAIICTLLPPSVSHSAFASSASARQTPSQRGKPDPDAPPGAPESWLPEEPWVMQRWLPYSVPALVRALHTSREGLRRWLVHRPLGDLARAQGLSQAALLRRLLEPARRELGPTAYATLLNHGRRTLTQRHLMQHMLFHSLHLVAYSSTVPALTGLSWPQIQSEARRGLFLYRILDRHGLDRRRVVDGVLNALLLNVRDGQAAGQMPSAQARYAYSDERQQLLFWWSGGGRAPGKR